MRSVTSTVAVIGAGFSGTMVAANLLRLASAARRPLRVLLFDRQPGVGKGTAYRTESPQHLLNVPASSMSAWPHAPLDFLRWAQARIPDVDAYAFLPRHLYGEYVHETFRAAVAATDPDIGVELRHQAVSDVARTGALWRIVGEDGTVDMAAAVVIATGHRLPDDPIGEDWQGTRARLVADPWAPQALAAIASDEPVALLGSGLTALDVALTLHRTHRDAPITALSRRGRLPEPHASARVVAADHAAWIGAMLAGVTPPSTRQLLRELRACIRAHEQQGGDWRAVIDGLRPHTAAIWGALSPVERRRFLRHARPLWEVHRHRMAPSVAATMRGYQASGHLRVRAARVLAAKGATANVELTIAPRGANRSETLSVAWVINCTGPGVNARTKPEPLLSSLLLAGHLCEDELGLGVLTGPQGQAFAKSGDAQRDLVVVGTLRKPQLWESTAVPELRVQAAEAAAIVLAHLDRTAT